MALAACSGSIPHAVQILTCVAFVHLLEIWADSICISFTMSCEVRLGPGGGRRESRCLSATSLLARCEVWISRALTGAAGERSRRAHFSHFIIKSALALFRRRRLCPIATGPTCEYIRVIFYDDALFFFLQKRLNSKLEFLKLFII